MPQKFHFVHERGDYRPLATEDIVTVWSGDIKKTVKYSESPIFFIYQGSWCRCYSLERNYQKVVNYVFNKISKDKKYVSKVRKIFDKRVKGFLSFIKEIKKVNWQEISTNELIRIKEKYVRLYHQTAPYGEPLPYFLKEKLQNILDAYLLKELKISDKEYEILMASLYQSFLSRVDQELWNIIKKYKNKPKEFEREIKKHTKKYEWILFDYASLIVDGKYFKNKAREFIKNPPKFIDYKKLKDKKKQIIKKYKINPLYRYYLDLLEELNLFNG